MDAILWILLPVFIAAGSALLSFYVMQARMDVAIARERESTALTRAQMSCHEQMAVEKIKAAEETAERRALDNFLGEIRVEERHYMRENKSLFLNRKAMVLQERLYFRNIPLSNWIEHEMTIEEGSDVRQLAKACSSFANKALSPGRPTA